MILNESMDGWVDGKMGRLHVHCRLGLRVLRYERIKRVRGRVMRASRQWHELGLSMSMSLRLGVINARGSRWGL